MPRGGKREGSGRPPGSKGKKGSLAERVEELSRNLPAVIPPKPIIDADEKDAAEQINDIMQHAGQMMRAFRALMGKTGDNLPPVSAIDDYMQWMNVVMRAAGMLLPYQRPTYRSIEVRTEHGIEDRQSRYLGDPAERLAQIVVGAILAQSVNVPDKKPETADHSKDFEGSDGGQLPEPVDNGDGVIVS